MRELTTRSISIRKGGRSNSTSEVSETTKVCTDPSRGQSFCSMLSKPLYTRTVREGGGGRKRQLISA